nr:MAG TPA: hypothetical protein [Caudoviricetes sp.]
MQKYSSIIVLLNVCTFTFLYYSTFPPLYFGTPTPLFFGTIVHFRLYTLVHLHLCPLVLLYAYTLVRGKRFRRYDFQFLKIKTGLSHDCTFRLSYSSTIALSYYLISTP